MFRFITRPVSFECWFQYPAAYAVATQEDQKQIEGDHYTSSPPVKNKKRNNKPVKRDPEILVPQPWKDHVKQIIGNSSIDPLKKLPVQLL